MNTARDYRLMGLVLSADRDKFPTKTESAWSGTVEFWDAMGLRPEGKTLAKKSQKLPHGPENSRWVDRKQEQKPAAQGVPRNTMQEFLKRVPGPQERKEQAAQEKLDNQIARSRVSVPTATGYTAPTQQDSKVMRTLLRDAAKFPDDARWSSLQEFNVALGTRPQNGYLLKRNTRTGHGPGNSYWSTDKPTKEELSQAKATRKAERGKKVRDQLPQTKTALRAALKALPKPVYPKFRVRTQQEQDAQVLLLYAALSPPDDGTYY